MIPPQECVGSDEAVKCTGSPDALTLQVLESAFIWAVQHHSPIIVMASTTGKTAMEMIRIIGQSNIKLIVMAHDPRRTGIDSSFSPDIIHKLQYLGHTFIRDHAPMLPSIFISRLFEKTFKISFLNQDQKKWAHEYGIGGKVCFLLALKTYKAGLIQLDRPCIFIGGSQSGANTALVLKIIKSNGRIMVNLVESIHLKK